MEKRKTEIPDTLELNLSDFALFLSVMKKIVTEVKQSEEWEDARMTILEFGIEQGIEQGGIYKLIGQVCRKLRRGKEPVQIADELEEDYETVADICETAGGFAPDYDSDRVCEEYFNRQK